MQCSIFFKFLSQRINYETCRRLAANSTDVYLTKLVATTGKKKRLRDLLLATKTKTSALTKPARMKRIRNDSPAMWSLCLLVVLLGWTCRTVSGQEVYSRTEQCGGEDSLEGYTSIEDINSDMQDELERIEDGDDALDVYNFILCPNTEFDAARGPLQPVLNGAVFWCGEFGNLSDNCTFTRGSSQVRIQDSQISDYKLESLEFRGLTFQQFTYASIAAEASQNTTAKFIDCHWKVGFQ